MPPILPSGRRHPLSGPPTHPDRPAYRIVGVETSPKERTVPAPEPDPVRRTRARRRAIVLVLHGGKARSSATVTGRSLSWLRALALAPHPRADRSTGRASACGSCATAPSGGTATAPARIEDARWALDRIRAELGDVPGRAARPLDGRPDGLPRRRPRLGRAASSPWPRGCRRASRSAPLAGRRLHAAHGRRDRITRAGDTRAYVERARAVADEATFTDMGDRGHYLLRGVAAWNAFAVDARTPGARARADPAALPESSSGLRMKLSCFIRRRALPSFMERNRFVSCR